jgi:hypothetical protein
MAVRSPTSLAIKQFSWRSTSRAGMLGVAEPHRDLALISNESRPGVGRKAIWQRTAPEKIAAAAKPPYCAGRSAELDEPSRSRAIDVLAIVERVQVADRLPS